jgi:DNA repair protein RecN (Recombination protein N)
MLKELHISNFAIIEDLTIEFEEGFNLLTGETGSGKSIIIEAEEAVK